MNSLKSIQPVKYQDFSSLDILNTFIGQYPREAVINIETLEKKVPRGNAYGFNYVEDTVIFYRVWFEEI